MYRRYFKRAIDLVAVICGGTLILPLIVIIGILVRVKLGSPVFFRQQRPGLRGKPFELVKFRTMTDCTGPDGELLPDADRLTRFGQFLRSSSLDELPELWNVLKGEMSLVGPRPLRMDYLPLYTPFQNRRHEVRPGITGLAQVSGRNALEWDDRFVLDVSYVDSCSLTLDIKILVKTLWKTVRREDISKEGHATMHKFTGSKNEAELSKNSAVSQSTIPD